MHLMVHPLRVLDAAASFRLAKAYSGDALKQSGRLKLT
jgi:hypothetical protein